MLYSKLHSAQKSHSAPNKSHSAPNKSHSAQKSHPAPKSLYCAPNTIVFAPDTILFVPEISSEPDRSPIVDASSNCIEISKEVYHKLAYRGSTEGIIAVAKAKNNSLENIQFSSKKPLILIAEGIEKPGNIGALLRSADAANVDAVLIANPKSDLYNSNIIRSSVGCVFTNQIATGTSEEIIAFLQKSNMAQLGLDFSI